MALLILGLERITRSREAVARLLLSSDPTSLLSVLVGGSTVWLDGSRARINLYDHVGRTQSQSASAAAHLRFAEVLGSPKQRTPKQCARG